MKKNLITAAFLALTLTALPVLASAAEEAPLPPAVEEAAPSEEAGESAPLEEANPTAAPEEPADPTPEPEPEPTSEPDPGPSLVPGLEQEEHRVYLRGSGDLVRPEGLLTRGEAACMIYSLLEYEP